ncbi:MAG: tRNA (adenosine(37)-N6)-dimethylallyltransferase MiaA [Frankia sp.]|nr:tRNA (adenosine(37)-N6)-dimethylallyltransferase MiaA [Frankia sp.]
MAAEPGLTARVVAIVGPTASGKSVAGLAVARAIGGEVVNADSMQLYRGMDIGTAKVTATQRDQVPHHLLDALDVTEEASVAAYQDMARNAIADISARGRGVVLVGGSGLYVRAAIDDLRFPGTDPLVRARLEDELAQVGAAALHERLRARDPVAAESVLPTNGRRIVRALEVMELTGRPFSDRAGMSVYETVYDTRIAGIAPDLATLDRRIEQRVDDMWAAGFVTEVRRLVDHGLRRSRTASRALGYQQILAFLAGECTEATARDDTVRATRRFARRQLSWFRRDRRVEWHPDAASAVRALTV